ncbi:MAG: leucine-rich repeat protein [Firmicutes bacterium]|nr:leucine-rich repeat protein [Bacillota bacterium]
MKKLYKLPVIAFIALVCALAASLVACGRGGSGEAKKLAAPGSLQIHGQTLIWSAVRNASGYAVDIDGAVFSAASNSFSLAFLTDAKAYAVKVKAVGSGTSYLDSEWSAAIGYTPEGFSDEPPATDKFEVTFNSNGGTAVAKVSGVENGTSIAKPGDPARDGYLFVGWYKENSFTTAWVFASDTVTGNLTLYAKWTPASAGLLFTQVGGTYSVAIGAATDPDIVIPSSHQGLPVTTIVKDGFKNATALTSVVIPQSVALIGEEAFKNCISLERITIPFVGETMDSTTNSASGITLSAGVKNLFGYLFGVVDYVTQHDAIPSSLKEVTVTGGVIPQNAFFYCYNIEKMTIGNNVVGVIGHSAFKDSGLKEVSIGNGVTGIGTRAFSGCGNLQKVEFIAGSKLTSIGDQAFEKTSITDITIPAGVTEIGYSAFYRGYGGALGSVIFEEGSLLKSIGNNAFAGSIKLTSITLPSGLISIGWDAFMDTGIWENAPANGVVYADKWAIGWKGSFSAVTLREDTAGIGERAFHSCLSFTQISIPASVITIGNSAFYTCASLRSLTFEPDGRLKYIGEYAFGGCAIATITIPVTVTDVGYRAFYAWSNTQIIRIPGRVGRPEGWDGSWDANCAAAIIWNASEKAKEFVDAVAVLPNAAAVVTLADALAAEALLPDVDAKYAVLSASEANQYDVVNAKSALEALKTKIALIKTAAEADAAATQAANHFIALVNALPAASAITADNADTVRPSVAAARAAFDGLNPAAAAKPGVTNAFNTLFGLEAKLRSFDPRPMIPDIGTATNVSALTFASTVNGATIGTFVLTESVTLASAITVGNGKNIMIRGAAADVTITLSGGGRLLVTGTGKLTMVGLNVVVSSVSSYIGGSDAFSNMGIGILDGAAGHAAEFNIYYCNFTGRDYSGSNGLLRIGGSTELIEPRGTFTIVGSVITSNQRALYGRTAQRLGGVYRIHDSVISADNDALYSGYYILTGATQISGDTWGGGNAGWNEMLDARGFVVTGTQTGSTVTLNTNTSTSLRYTTNGTNPTTSSSTYSAPFAGTLSSVRAAFVVYGNGQTFTTAPFMFF